MSARTINTLYLVLLTLVVSIVVALTITIANGGVRSGFWARWARDAALGSLVSVPTSLLVAPALRRLRPGPRR
jgi:hypothetical protein